MCACVGCPMCACLRWGPAEPQMSGFSGLKTGGIPYHLLSLLHPLPPLWAPIGDPTNCLISGQVLGGDGAQVCQNFNQSPNPPSPLPAPTLSLCPALPCTGTGIWDKARIPMGPHDATHLKQPPGDPT